jgi:four helix bundle protein
MQNYKHLKVREKAHQFTLDVYETTQLFHREEVYGLTTQLRRSASSIPASIAEGCEKCGQSELARVLNIFLGSANETGYFLILSKDLKYLNETSFNKPFSAIYEIKAMFISLIGKLRPVKA